MKITARKASAIAIALAIPASAMNPVMAQEAPAKETTVNVNLGKDAADAEVTLLASDKEVATETADEAGEVSFTYEAQGAETLEVQVDGETINLSDAKCKAVKTVAADAPEAGSETPAPTSGSETPAPTSGSETPAPTSGSETPAPTSGSETPAPTSGSETPAPTSGSETPAPTSGSETPAPTSGSETPAPTSGSETPAPTTTPKTDDPNTDGGNTGVDTESQSEIAQLNAELNRLENKIEKADKSVKGDLDDAKDFANKLDGALNSDDATLKGFNEAGAKQILKDVNNLVEGAEKAGKDNVVVPTELQLDILSMVGPALKSAITSAVPPQFQGIANTALDFIGSKIKSSDSPLIKKLTGGSSDDADGAGATDGAGVDAPVDPNAASPVAETSEETVDLNTNVDGKSFTVDLEEGTVSVDCDVETEEAEAEGEETSTSATPTATPTPTSVAPAAAPVSTPGPKVNTGGAVEGASFFAKVKALF